MSRVYDFANDPKDIVSLEVNITGSLSTLNTT